LRFVLIQMTNVLLIWKAKRLFYLRKSYSIIEDEYVDIEFGTGCLKVTPAHDMNDKALGEKHNLK
jgi:valyl-tRNA synthetase